MILKSETVHWNMICNSYLRLDTVTHKIKFQCTLKYSKILCAQILYPYKRKFSHDPKLGSNHTPWENEHRYVKKCKINFCMCRFVTVEDSALRNVTPLCETKVLIAVLRAKARSKKSGILEWGEIFPSNNKNATQRNSCPIYSTASQIEIVSLKSNVRIFQYRQLIIHKK